MKINKQELSAVPYVFDKAFHEAFVYKWVRRTTEEFYVGVHLGHPEDGYIGSGHVFKEKYKAAPTEWFREYVIPCGTYEEALELEELIVDEDLVKMPKCLNLRTGGRQGKASDSTKIKISVRLKGKPKSEAHKQSMRKPKSKEHAAKVGIAMKKKVKCVETGIVYASATDAMRALNGNDSLRSNIASVCSGNRQIAGGYHWEKV